MTRLLAGLAAGATAVAGALLVVVGASAPAAAAGFCSGDGVNVVVDFHQLGGGVQKGCDPSGGGKAAASVFPAAGFPLTYAQKQPGFVCRVEGKPASDPCVDTPPPDAYWGLWWSDGESGAWTYSSSGVGSLKVPSGGSVAFSWNAGGGTAKPGVAPPTTPSTPTPKPTPEPKPKPQPAPKPTSKPAPEPAPAPSRTPSPNAGGANGTGGTGGATTRGPSATPSGSAQGDRERGRRDTREDRADGRGAPSATSLPAGSSPTVSPSATESESATTAAGADPSDPATVAAEAEGLPAWVPLTLLALFGAGTATALVVRRRSLRPAPRGGAGWGT